MKKIVIINTGSSNILSLKRATEKFHDDVIVSDSSEVILSAYKIIFPGVGAFKKVMTNLQNKKLIETMNKIKDKNIPLLGICLGSQLFFDESEEFGLSKGLSLLHGKVRKLPSISKESEKIKIPSIGWYNLNLNKEFTNTNYLQIINLIKKNEKFYFVHSYFADPINKEDILATYNFGGHEIPAIVSKKNVIGCQFHPEKSGTQGLKLIFNFLKLKQ